MGDSRIDTVPAHAVRWHDALCTWVNRGGQLKAELQLAADMICWQPPTQ